ncbi:isochorismatase family protein [Streptomyces sp. CC208A]|uniref:isochorismatase family protein n=1 Tax=Streptomyces sp. CC208A TaxID=3044573 RepID=UPI0024A95D87|nr:isochorismatase family protein [Streptomyces sp. CC208A]
MPAEGDLPPGTVSWTPDPRRAVLLVHDMQRYFLRPFAAGDSPGGPLVRNAALLRERCAAAGIPVAYTAQPGDMTAEQRGLLRDFWGPGMRTSPEDRQVVDELAPAPQDWLLTKWRYSAFVRTDLLERMREAGRDQLIICGVYAHVGVLMSAVDSFTHDIQPFLVADATADFSAAYHRLALTYAAERCARVATTKQLLTELEDAR